MAGTALKQISLANKNLIVGNDRNQASAFAPGSAGQILAIGSDGRPVWVNQVTVPIYTIITFSETGPATPAENTYDMLMPISEYIQGDNKDSMTVSINGLIIPHNCYSLTETGPYVLKLNMAAVGYSLDANDTVTVSYTQVTIG